MIKEDQLREIRRTIEHYERNKPKTVFSMLAIERERLMLDEIDRLYKLINQFTKEVSK